MRKATIYTLNYEDVTPAVVGGYVDIVNYRSPHAMLTAVSSPNDILEFATVPMGLQRLKLYHIGEYGKEDRLVAIDPELVDTIKFVVAENLRSELVSEQFNVRALMDKNMVLEYQLRRCTEEKEEAKRMLAENQAYFDTLPIWKFIKNRVLDLWMN